jgi:hypothetical protein
MNVPTAQAEWALRRLTSRTADYLETTRTPVVLGRHSPDRLATRDANALVDLVAVAESFCVARLATVGITADVNTWDKRAKAWRRRSIDVVGYAGWPVLMGFVEARNAIQHGLGKLTDRQLGKHKAQTLTFISAAAIRRNGDAIIIGTSDIARCDSACANFIRWLDTAAPPPN